MVLEPCSNNRARAGGGARGLAPPPPYFLKKLNKIKKYTFSNKRNL